MLVSIRERLYKNYRSDIAIHGIYQQESLYFDYDVDHGILVVSYNCEKNKIFVYYRNNYSITSLRDYFIDLPYVMISNQLVWDTDNKTEDDIIAILETTLFRIDNMILHQSKVIVEDNNKVILNGSYLDINNNSVKAPFHLFDCFAQFMGENNSIYIHPEAKIRNVNIIFSGSNAKITIDKTGLVMGDVCVAADGQLVIGVATKTLSDIYITVGINSSITIGNNCIFEGNNQIISGLACQLFSTDDQSMIIESRDIEIGDHVWFAYGSRVDAGGKICNDSVVAHHSVVNKEYPSNVLLAGTPAQIVKENISWS